MQITFWKNRQTLGFTIMEVMVVTVLIAILAGFILPNFSKAVKRSRVRDGITQLSAIYAANMIYKAQNGDKFYNIDTSDLNVINSGLGINIVANEMTYEYDYIDDATFTATATRVNGDFAVRINQNTIDMTATPPNPCCSSGTCVGLAGC